MTVIDLIEILQKMQDEIGGDRDSIDAHKQPSSVEIYVVDRDITIDFNIVDVVPTTRIGCGCWNGVAIRIKRDEPRGLSAAEGPVGRRVNT
jgi:hypothetical protein